VTTLTRPVSAPRHAAAGFIRGVALWLLILGLAYLGFGLALVDAYHHPPRGTDVPWLSLPWGLSEGQLLSGAMAMAFAALASSVLLWRLTRVGRLMSTLLLLGVAGWAVWVVCTIEFALGPLAFAGTNVWLASILWRSDAAALFRRMHQASE